MKTTPPHRALSPIAMAMAMAIGLSQGAAHAGPPNAAATQGAEIEHLKKRVAALEEGTEQQAAEAQADAKDSWTQRIELHGLLEVDALYSSPDNGPDTSDVVVSTAEIGITAKPNDWVEGELTLLYEEGMTGVELDVAKVRIGNSEVTPGYIDAGRMYVPFGRYETQMLSDPLTLNIGETREDALLVGFEKAGVYASGFLFNGDTQDKGGDHIEHYGANLGYKYEADGNSIDIGASAVSSIGDSDGIWDAAVLATPSPYVTGVNAHAIGVVGPVTLSGEYVTATNNLMGAGTGTKAAAWALEAGYTFDIQQRETTVALGVQGTEEAGFLSQPKNRAIGAVSVGVIENLSVGLEWARDEDYAGDHTDTATARLSLDL